MPLCFAVINQTSLHVRRLHEVTAWAACSADRLAVGYFMCPTDLPWRCLAPLHIIYSPCDFVLRCACVQMNTYNDLPLHLFRPPSSFNSSQRYVTGPRRHMCKAGPLALNYTTGNRVAGQASIQLAYMLPMHSDYGGHCRSKPTAG